MQILCPGLGKHGRGEDRKVIRARTRMSAARSCVLYMAGMLSQEISTSGFLNKTHTVTIPVDVPNIYRGNLIRPTLGEELQANYWLPREKE